jgi:phosphohistidine phosphatase SixA
VCRSYGEKCARLNYAAKSSDFSWLMAHVLELLEAEAASHEIADSGRRVTSAGRLGSGATVPTCQSTTLESRVVIQSNATRFKMTASLED